MKLIEKDGKHYRMRRGVLVEIPAEWVGRTVHSKTLRQRPSKQIHKRRKSNGWKPYASGKHGRPPVVPNKDES